MLQPPSSPVMFPIILEAMLVPVVVHCFMQGRFELEMDVWSGMGLRILYLYGGALVRGRSGRFAQ
jgi:hypothetical protein